MAEPSKHTSRLFLLDKSGQKFLIDSGSEICVIPSSPTMNKSPQSNFSLFALIIPKFQPMEVHFTKLWTLSYSHWLSFPENLLHLKSLTVPKDRDSLLSTRLSDTFGICWKLEISQCLLTTSPHLCFGQKVTECSSTADPSAGFHLSSPTILYIPGSDNIAVDVLSRVSAITFQVKLTMTVLLRHNRLIRASHPNSIWNFLWNSKRTVGSNFYVFLRRDMFRRPLQQPYDGPFQKSYKGRIKCFFDINGKRHLYLLIDANLPSFLNTEDLVTTLKPRMKHLLLWNLMQQLQRLPSHLRSGRKVHLPTRYR
ncbi:hypothetical protein TNCV_947281 [Trichonephila clavipes]|nr:hypothetical protein TNCV_947281 [Trichonephila clavipes]